MSKQYIYEPLNTAAEVEALRQKMLTENYPASMTLCEVAGINGDSPEVCLFTGTEHCTCEANHDN